MKDSCITLYLNTSFTAWYKEKPNTRNSYSIWSCFVCHSALKRKVIIPAKVNKIVLVFTTKVNKNSFTLIEKKMQGPRPMFFPNRAKPLTPAYVGIKEYRGTLTCLAKRAIYNHLKKGYKYVHIEY